MDTTFIVAEANATIFIVALVMMLIVFLVVFAALVMLFRPWFQAFLSGTPISFIQLVGMTMRKVPRKTIINQGIAANQAGYPVAWSELERAYLQGVDLEKVTLAYITARRRGDDFTFEELVSAESESRLADLIGR